MSTTKKHVFTPIEKKVFMDILKSFSCIENKNTDSITLREKNTAWDNITREYNASPHVTAEVSNKQLRRLWMNLKQRQREAITKERQHRMATGGGPSTSSAEIDPDVAIVAPALMVEIQGAIDSDAAFLEPENVSMDVDFNQNNDISLDVAQHQQPSTSTTVQISQQSDLSPIPFPTTTPLPPLILTLPRPCTITTPPPRGSSAPPPPRSITTPPPPRSTTTPPPPRSTTTPPPPRSTTSVPPQSISSNSTSSFQHRKQNILEKEYRDRFNRASEIHALEKDLLTYKIREAKAKAELAELILQRERTRGEDTE